MAGETTTGSLTESLPYSIARARLIREFEGVFMRTTDASVIRALKTWATERVHPSLLRACVTMVRDDDRATAVPGTQPVMSVGKWAYVESQFSDEKRSTGSVHRFINITAASATIGLVQLPDQTYWCPPVWLDRVERLQAAERAPRPPA